MTAGARVIPGSPCWIPIAVSPSYQSSDRKQLWRQPLLEDKLAEQRDRDSQRAHG
jgi:hypothetical protein